MEKARSLNIVQEKHRGKNGAVRHSRGRFWGLLIKAVVLITVVTVGLVWGSHRVVYYYQIIDTRTREAYQSALARFTRVEVRREIVRPDAVPLTQLAKAVAVKTRVPSVVLQAVIEQESSGGEHLYRFEPDAYANLRKKQKGTDSEIRMLASSHGVAHVMGFNAIPRCHVHWSELYDPATGLECGAKLIRENIERHSSVRDTSRRIWLALRDYNGSGPAAEAYATRVMARIGAFLLDELREEL